MRVLETSQLTAMTKKKHRLRKQKRDERFNNDSSDEAAGDGIQGKSCEHVCKSVVLSNVKKALKQGTLGECPTCKKDSGKGKEKGVHDEVTSADTMLPDDIEITIWCCLQCGHQGCDRNSPGQHALSHYQTAHSQPHAVVLNLNNWAVWCYECDDDITLDGSRKLTECVEFIKKQAGATKPERPSSGKKKEKELELVEKDKQNVTSKASSAVLHKVKGLNNLGNTCFFNAVMQSMNQTHVLEPVMLELSKKGIMVTLPLEIDEPEKNIKHEDKKLTPLSIVLAEAGSLTSAMVLFLKTMSESGKGPVSPRMLFNQVCQKAPRFKGYQQQDSHELLRYLLDGMRSEENKRVKEGILKEFGYQTTVNPKNVDEETKEKIKDYGRFANHTFVDGVFGGQLISTVHCEECRQPSEVYEPFLDLSLPITEAKVWPGKGLFQKCSRRVSQSSTKTNGTEQDGTADGTFVKKTEEETGMSKHQQKAAKKKAKKESKQNKKKGKLLKLDDKKEQSDPGLLQDPNDADSETSIDKRDLRRHTPPAVHSRDSSVSSTSTGRRDSNASPLPDEIVKDESSQTTQIDGNVQIPQIVTNDVMGNEGKDSRTRNESGEKCQNEKDVSQESIPLMNGILDDNETSDGKGSISEKKDLIDDSTQQNGPLEGDSLDGCVRSKLADGTDDVTKKLGGLKLDEQKKNKSLPNGDVVQMESGEGDSSEKFKEKSSVPLEELGAVGGQEVITDIEGNRKAMVALAPKYQSSSHECSVQSCLSQFTAQELLTGKNKFGCENCTKTKYGDNKGDKIMYTNASKQLLIFHPPPILTLHLKRFQQAGYSLRKVNRHVDFPLTLDLAPFCSENCKDVADGKNRILYSLYGVVEHSGGLQGGHYTAYVKVRQPSQRLLRFVQVIQNGRNPKKQSNVNKEQQNMAETKGEDGNSQDVAMATQKTDQDGGHDSNGNEDDKSQAENAKLVSDFEPPIHPTEGKWFYISDTHVTEATETKVLNSQAYILFYERLL
ncbi:ubiquitin carboxyl-terminal hydrolase 16-like [Glandiceps talaboti]